MNSIYTWIPASVGMTSLIWQLIDFHAIALLRLDKVWQNMTNYPSNDGILWWQTTFLILPPEGQDPEFAKMGGFDTQILHGLCTYWLAGRTILASVCDNGPAGMKSFVVRFTGVVFPGETLIAEGWKTEEDKYIIQTKTQDGRIVLSNWLAEVA